MKRMALVLLLFLAFVVNGCFLAANREINLLVTRTNTGGSEVTVTYRVPPPRTGRVYVLWVVNPDLRRRARIGVLPPSSNLRAVKTRVDFWATGAVISVESSADVEQMSSTWALYSGDVFTGTPAAGNAALD